MRRPQMRQSPKARLIQETKKTLFKSNYLRLESRFYAVRFALNAILNDGGDPSMGGYDTYLIPRVQLQASQVIARMTNNDRFQTSAILKEDVTIVLEAVELSLTGPAKQDTVPVNLYHLSYFTLEWFIQVAEKGRSILEENEFDPNDFIDLNLVNKAKEISSKQKLGALDGGFPDEIEERALDESVADQI